MSLTLMNYFKMLELYLIDSKIWKYVPNVRCGRNNKTCQKWSEYKKNYQVEYRSNRTYLLEEKAELGTKLMADKILYEKAIVIMWEGIKEAEIEIEVLEDRIQVVY